MKLNQMTNTKLRIIFWRVWDSFIKLVWVAIPGNLRNLLWRFVSSKSNIREHIENTLSSSSGVIIQVGSNDGVSNDPLFESILIHKRQSYLVEPIDYLAEKLRFLHKSNPNVKVCEFAIHPNSSSVEFFCLPRDAAIKMGDLWKPWFDQIGSFSRQHLTKHSPFIDPFIEKISIPCITLDRLISDNNVNEISILHIDAEGFDLEVLGTIDLVKIKPSMIMIEHKHLPLKPLLRVVSSMQSRGYVSFVYHDDIVFSLRS
jgi:FkbM family methyltransferase